MYKKLLMLMMYLGFAGVLFSILTKEEADIDAQGSSIVRIGNEIVSVYVDGKDYTEEYKNREQQAKESIAGYFNKDCSEIRFYNYCMLEMDGMTIDVEIEQRQYTVLMNMEGEIISIKNIPRKSVCVHNIRSFMGYFYERYVLF